MSTIREIIERADELRPNAFSAGIKMRWVTELDGRIAADVMMMSIEDIRQLEYKGEEGLDKEPLVGFPHDEIYDLYLIARIDAANGEHNRYQNDMQLYNESFANFMEWFVNRYEPAQGDGSIEPKDGVPVYYLTAYGVAVKQGYKGTVNEWLESIKGIRPHFAVGNVETLPLYSAAYVTISGTDALPVLNFGIPQSSASDIDLKNYIDEMLAQVPSIKFTEDGSVPDDLEEGDIWLTPDEER